MRRWKSTVSADETLEERKTYAVTRGMRNLLGRGSVARECSSCGLKVGKYPGRYPGSCPSCSGELSSPGVSAPAIESSAGFVTQKLKELQRLLSEADSSKNAVRAVKKLLASASSDIEEAKEYLSEVPGEDFELELDGVIQVLDSVVASL